ncbi:MAG TPA: cell division protein SepF [Nitriliruptorales bacterium]|nr:cell division protein SepF [Nitriliruptorales bacterium]
MWRKTLVYLGLVEEPEEHDEFDPAEELPMDTRDTASPASAVSPRTTAPARATAGVERTGREDRATVRSLRPEDRQTHVRRLQGGVVRVQIVRAADFDDAAEQVGDRYRSGQPVLLDVGEVDARTARRLIDFVSGVIFGLRGQLLSAGGRAFLLVPEGVDVPLDERRRLSDLGYPLHSAPSNEA